jgi:hypothetical protein
MMPQDEFSDPTRGLLWFWAWSRHFGRARGVLPRCPTRGRRPSAKPTMQEGLTLQQLFASDMTIAVLRADALDMRRFETTLQEAAKRLATRRQAGSARSEEA